MRAFAPCTVAAAALVALAACTETVGPEATLVRATIADDRADPDWSVTGTGRILDIAVTTYGNSCYSIGETRTDVDSAARTVRVEPYDVRMTGTPCEDLLQSFSHAATVEVNRSGNWEVVLIGLGAEGEILRVERIVEVE